MIVVPPVQIDGSNLVAAASTIPEPDPSQGEVVWASGGAYAVKAQRVTLDNHRKYECLTAHSGSAVHPKDDPINWEPIGFTNRYAMFDRGRSVQSIGPVGSPLVAKVVPGKRVNALFLGRLAAAYARVYMHVGATLVYSKQLALMQRRTKSWSTYYLGEFKQLRSVLLLDLPVYAGATVTVELDNGSLPARCAAMVVGRSGFLGDAEWGGANDQIIFGGFKRDDFGNAELLDRRVLPTTSQTLVVPKDQVNTVLDLREQCSKLAAVYSGMGDKTADGYAEMFLIYGVPTRWRVSTMTPKEAKVEIDLEEF